MSVTSLDPTSGATPAEADPTVSAQIGEERERQLKERSRRWRLVLGAGDELKRRAQRGKRYGVPRVWSPKDTRLEWLLAHIYGKGSRQLDQSSSWQMSPLHRLNPRALDALSELEEVLPRDVAGVVSAEIAQRLDAQALLRAADTGRDVQISYAMLERIVSQADVLSDADRQRARQLIAPLIDELSSIFTQRVRRSFAQELSSECAPALTHYIPPQEVDWSKTILYNLKHYQPDSGLLIPERLIRRQRTHELDADLLICLDRSGSMASSVIHASVYAAALSSVPGLRTRVVMFNHEVCDLSASKVEPIDLIFASHPHGGTSIIPALEYCAQHIERPQKTTLVFISDLIDDTPLSTLTSRVSRIKQMGVQLLFILALSDHGVPFFSDEAAQALARLGIPALYCSPERFPELIRDALNPSPISVERESERGVSKRSKSSF